MLSSDSPAHFLKRPVFSLEGTQHTNAIAIQLGLDNMASGHKTDPRRELPKASQLSEQRTFHKQLLSGPEGEDSQSNTNNQGIPAESSLAPLFTESFLVDKKTPIPCLLLN